MLEFRVNFRRIEIPSPNSREFERDDFFCCMLLVFIPQVLQGVFSEVSVGFLTQPHG